MDRLSDGYLVRTSESLYSVQSMANIRIRLIFDSSNTLVNRLGPNSYNTQKLQIGDNVYIYKVTCMHVCIYKVTCMHVCIYKVTCMHVCIYKVTIEKVGRVCVCVRACVCVRFSLHSVRFGQLLRCAHKRIVNTMKVYIERLHGDLTEYRRLNSVRNASIKNDRAAFWQEKATTLEEAAIRKDQGTLFRELRSLRSGNRNFSTFIKDQAGRTLTSEPECIARWQEHFSELLNQPLTPPTEELIDRANHPNDCPLCTTDDIAPEEVRKVPGQLKNARASGICTVTAELLKNGGKAVVTWLTKIFNHVWSTEQIPEDWHNGIILPFWKRKGDALTCSNHRGITLLSIPGKTFARVVINRAIPAMHHHRRPHQAGFMPGRSTTDHISAIRLLAEKAREFRKDRALFIAFINLNAAFDSVDCDCLWHILHSIGIPPKIVRVLERLYTDTSSCVRINKTLSDWFTISSGVRQGCVAAVQLHHRLPYGKCQCHGARNPARPIPSHRSGICR